jgi:hypothetical protein
MAFITSGGKVVCFAEVSDVQSADQRLFEANEGLTDAVVEDALFRSTDRILTLIRNTDWWRDINVAKQPNMSYQTLADMPTVDPNKIVAREADFTELCVYYALWNYLLPKIADFSKEDNAERAKIGFNQEKYNFRFEELINSGDWYDFGGDGVVQSNEKLPGHMSLRRIR